MKYVVQNLLNFNPPYSGNLMKSLLALEKAMFDSEMAMVYLFPKEAMERDWVRDLISEGKRVYFRNSTVFEALNSINNDYPVSIIHSHFSYIDDYKGIIRFKRDHPEIKTVFHHHDANFVPYVSKGYPFPVETARKIKKKAEREIAKRIIMSDAHIACGKDVYDNLRELNFNGFCCIENSIDFRRLDRYAEICRNDFNDKYNRIAILIFGTDFERKGVDIAIKAIAPIAEEYGISLCIVMAVNVDENIKKIKRLMGEEPEWVKILPPREDVASYYRSADLFISPSRAEGMTYSVIECAYCKCPMIVSDICGQGHARAIPGAKIVENENTEMMREAIIESITVDNSSLEKAYNYVKENYSLDNWCNKILDLYNNLLENGKRNAE